jgi:hypothetical protein
VVDRSIVLPGYVGASARIAGQIVPGVGGNVAIRTRLVGETGFFQKKVTFLFATARKAFNLCIAATNWRFHIVGKLLQTWMFPPKYSGRAVGTAPFLRCNK